MSFAPVLDLVPVKGADIGETRHSHDFHDPVVLGFAILPGTRTVPYAN